MSDQATGDQPPETPSPPAPVPAAGKAKKDVWFGKRYPRVAHFFVPLTRNFLRPFCAFLYGYRWRGLHHIPRRGAVLIAPNHVSLFDPSLVGVAINTRRYRYMANESYFRHPVIAFFMYVLAVFPVDLKARFDRRAYKMCLETLDDGLGLIVFPEGTRSADGMLKAFQPGPARMALLTGTPIVPVAITGAHEVWPRGTSRPRLTGHIRARFYPPVVVEKLENGKEMGARIAEINAQVARPIERRLRAHRRLLAMQATRHNA